jgi:hypothetical protein
LVPSFVLFYVDILALFSDHTSAAAGTFTKNGDFLLL